MEHRNMNRSTIYEYLKSTDLYPLYYSKTGYHIRFVLQRHQTFCRVNFGYGFVRGVESIYLCGNELVIESKYGDMKINLYYKDIQELEVYIEEDSD